MNILTKEKLKERNNHGLTMKELRNFVENNPQIKDATPVLCERIEDLYFDKENGWEVYLVKGEWWNTIKEMNKNMDEEIIRRKKKLKKQYPKIENPLTHKVEMTDELKEQFFPSWCITKEKDNSAVLICNHY
jgi:hypothetical protein